MAKKQRLDKAISMQGNLSRSEVKTRSSKGSGHCQRTGGKGSGFWSGL